MNTGSDFQQEPLALKQGQPRIFAAGNGQDFQPRSVSGPQPSPGHILGNQPQQEPPTVYDNRTRDIKGKGVDRSGMDSTPGFQQYQQQPERPSDQRDNQTFPHGQTGETLIRSVYTQARSPAMQYRDNLERGKDWNRAGVNGAPDNKPTEPQLPLPPINRPPVKRATEPHFKQSPLPALRKDSSGSSNEHQQRFMGPRGQTIDHQQTLNLNGDNVTSKLDRRQSLYSPVVTITTNVPDAEPPNDSPLPSPKNVRSFGQRSDSTQRQHGRYHSLPKPSSLNTEGSPPATGGYSSGDISGSSPELTQHRDPRRQLVGRSVQGSIGSFQTQDSSRKASLTSNVSVPSDRERGQSPAVLELQPVQNRPHKSTKPPRLDNGQASPPPAHHQSRERLRAGAAPTNRGLQMDSFYGGDASSSGVKKLSMRNGEEVDHTAIDEGLEPHFYPLELHLLHPQLLCALLQYLTFYDWCILQGVNKSLRSQLSHVRELKEEVLERYLSTIGYARWVWEEDEPLAISLRVKSSRLPPTIVLTGYAGSKRISAWCFTANTRVRQNLRQLPASAGLYRVEGGEDEVYRTSESDVLRHSGV